MNSIKKLKLYSEIQETLENHKILIELIANKITKILNLSQFCHDVLVVQQ